jgi:hypothetical protein
MIYISPPASPLSTLRILLTRCIYSIWFSEYIAVIILEALSIFLRTD